VIVVSSKEAAWELEAGTRKNCKNAMVNNATMIASFEMFTYELAKLTRPLCIALVAARGRE
jgi:hypothetical protein